MKGSLHVIVFAAALGIVCATLLAAANYLLKDFQKRNEQAERLRSILAVLDVQLDARTPLEDLSARELVELARQKVREGHVTYADRDGRDKTLTYYAYDHPAAGRLRAVPFSGMGLWGPIEGLLCLKADQPERGALKEIFRISFPKHEETPGLGGEIESDDFREQFEDKSIVSDEGEPGIRIIRGGEAQGVNEVDAISGATLTCQKVEAMLNRTIVLVREHRREILKENTDGQ